MAYKEPKKNNSKLALPIWLASLLKKRVSSVFGVSVASVLVAVGATWYTDEPQAQAAVARADSTYRLTGRVIHVADGDTINLQVQGQRERIRLASIDAPESEGRTDRPGQPYADQAQQALTRLVANKTLTVRCFEKDQYGRHICDVLLPDVRQTANQLMVSQGWAWAYTASKERYLYDKNLKKLQRTAKKQQRGLWQGANPKAPWQWRYDCWQQKKCN